MQNRMTRCATVFVLAMATTAVLPGAAVADRTVVNHSVYKHGANVKIVKRQRHRHAAGHRFRKQEVVVVKNWRARGLPRPGRNEIYVADGESIYLAAAATLLVKALIE